MLEAAGFCVLRFNFYGAEVDARKMNECTIETHADDLDLAVQWMKDRQQGQKVSVVGHGLGGMTVLCSKARGFDAAVLWDPTHPSQGDFRKRTDAAWLEELGRWRWDWRGIPLLVTPAYTESWRRAPADAGAAGLAVPLLVVAAGDGPGADRARRYVELAQEPKRFTAIANANGSFLTDEASAQLLEETISWLNGCGR
jgi:dienelactone hydrolase